MPVDDLAMFEINNIYRRIIPIHGLSNFRRHHHHLRLGIMRTVFVINAFFMEGNMLSIYFKR